MIFVTAACSEMFGTYRWYESYKQHRGETQLLLCTYEPRPKFTDERMELFAGVPWPGHDRKYDPLKSFVREHPDDWFLITDTDDVVFQKTIELPAGGADVLLSWEGLDYKDAPYWQKALTGEFERLKNTPIFNAGLYAMKGNRLAECFDAITYWSGKTNDVVDQLAIGMYLLDASPPYMIWDDFLCLYDRLNAVRIKQGKFISVESGKPFMAVHGNGSYGTFLNLVCPWG